MIYYVLSSSGMTKKIKKCLTLYEKFDIVVKVSGNKNSAID